MELIELFCAFVKEHDLSAADLGVIAELSKRETSAMSRKQEITKALTRALKEALQPSKAPGSTGMPNIEETRFRTKERE